MLYDKCVNQNEVAVKQQGVPYCYQTSVIPRTPKGYLPYL